MKTMNRLLKPNSKMICSDSHSFQKVIDILGLEQSTMSYFSTDVFQGEMAYARFFQEKIDKQMPLCSYRRYTLSEIINSVIENEFILNRFDEHPFWTNENVLG